MLKSNLCFCFLRTTLINDSLDDLTFAFFAREYMIGYSKWNHRNREDSLLEASSKKNSQYRLLPSISLFFYHNTRSHNYSNSPQNQNIPSGFQNREEQAISQPGISKENPASEKFVPRTQWSPQERDDDISPEEAVANDIANDETR